MRGVLPVLVSYESKKYKFEFRQFYEINFMLLASILRVNLLIANFKDNNII